MKFTSVIHSSDINILVNYLSAKKLSGAIECNKLQKSQMTSASRYKF